MKDANRKAMFARMRHKGNQVLPALKKGTLGVSTAHESTPVLKKKLVKKAEKIGEKKVVGKLGALAVLHKNTNPKLAKKERSLQHYVAGSVVGKKRVKYPKGLSKSKREHPARRLNRRAGVDVKMIEKYNKNYYR